ncbi:MAG: 16S rRNA (cytosine(967)-C(5))-methyltransferase RsmB [Gammaproteobacteria bacterium]|nr:16S rRNA (cytosine(967)-C(5))-methyltransferase RsmB [Gammaproteobacteria bacterium]
MTNSTNPRWIAVQAILQVVDQGRSVDEVFNSDWYRSLELEKRDLALSRELVSGFCRWYFALSTLLASRLQKPLRARDRDIEVVLILGLYQLLIMRTEPHAAVNETVKLALAQKKSWARGLVNALLRGVIRDRIELDSSAQAQAYPDWIMSRIRRDWGEQAEAVLMQGNNRPPMTLRVDTRQATIDNAISTLRSAGIEASRHSTVTTAIELSSPCEVTQLPGFEQGMLSVQDAAAQLAVPLLDCKSGVRVLDACAAPGGKTAQLLQHYENIELDALDSSEARLERLRQNLQRINKPARILIGDAASPEAWFDGNKYDCILADVPCSASGVIRRHPDIKLLRRESDIMPLLAKQRKIVDALWRLLKPGGKMLYCTCSVFRDENEVQIAKFLQRHPDCAEVKIDNAGWGEPRPHGRQVLTGSDNMDGFYYGLLTRSGGE